MRIASSLLLKKRISGDSSDEAIHGAYISARAAEPRSKYKSEFPHKKLAAFIYMYDNTLQGSRNAVPYAAWELNLKKKQTVDG